MRPSRLLSFNCSFKAYFLDFLYFILFVLVKSFMTQRIRKIQGFAFQIKWAKRKKEVDFFKRQLKLKILNFLLRQSVLRLNFIALLPKIKNF